MKMRSDRRVAVIGALALEQGHDVTRSLEEMTFHVTRQVVEDAGLSRTSVDGVVLSGHDQTDGRVISCMVSAGPAQGVGKDVTMIASAGEHALIYGYLRLLAGQGENVLVIGWGKPSESRSPEHAELVAAEPYLLRDVGMNQTIAAALQASRLASAGPTGTVVAWPLSQDQLPGRGDSVYALVLALEGSFPAGGELAWITGAAWASGPYDLGARDPADFSLLQSLAAQLDEKTGSGPATWDALEIAASSEPAVAGAVASLGLNDEVSINPSGPLHLQPSSPHIAGLGRMVRAVQHASSSSAASVTAGAAFQGFAGQGVTLMTFSSER